MKTMGSTILFLLLTGLSTGGCKTGILKIDSLCVMSPEEGRCWIKKEEDKGPTILEMKNWYALDEEDLRKILNKLKECDDQSKMIQDYLSEK